MSKTPFEIQYFVRHRSNAAQRRARGLGFACLAILLQSCASAPSTAALAPQTTVAALSPPHRLASPPAPVAAPPLTTETPAAALMAPAVSGARATNRLAEIEQHQRRDETAPAVEDQSARPAVISKASFITVAPRTTPPPPPRVLSPALQEGSAPNLFGSVALTVSHTPEDGQWRRIADSRLPTGEGPWTPILDRARGLPLMQQLQVINASVNRAITFTSDIQQYGVDDYWATARESLTSGRGDCEDYAIAKLQLLQALGVPADDLYLVIVRDLDRQADHAVLAVRAEGRFWVLDSGAGVMSAESVRDYRPIMTYSAHHAWLHGFRRAPDVMVASAGGVGGAQ